MTASKSRIWILSIIAGLSLSHAFLNCPSTNIRLSGNPLCNAKKLRGRGIPYVEDYEEQCIRRLWESGPFTVARSVVDDVLSKDATSGPLLRKLDPVQSPKQSGFEHLFDCLYKMGKKQGDYGNISAPNEKQDKRKHFLLQIAYRGSNYCGWQTQPKNEGLPSVQETLENWLSTLEGGRVDLRVCGRTDAGVHAVGQVARYRSHNPSLNVAQVLNHLSQIPGHSSNLACLNALSVGKSFHPSFVAQSRAYVYLIDAGTAWRTTDEIERLVRILNLQLQKLQGEELDYIALSYGRLKTQTSICKLFHAQAHLVQAIKTGNISICIELVGNRFLRRMVRILVSTTLLVSLRCERFSLDENALSNILHTQDRSNNAAAAPPNGLIFVGATFDVENPK